MMMVLMVKIGVEGSDVGDNTLYHIFVKSRVV